MSFTERSPLACTSLDLSFEECLDLKPLSRLTNLRDVYLTGVADGSQLAEIMKLPRLETLTLNNCQGITDLSWLKDAGSSIKSLNVFKCDKLISLEGIQNAPCLEFFEARGCEGLLDLQALRHSKSLTEVVIRRCSGVTDISPFFEIKGLSRANITCCPLVPESQRAQLRGAQPKATLYLD